MGKPIPRILVVTADERWRDCCTQALIAEGCDVKTISEGARALEVMHRRMFDVIVIDDSCTDMGPIEFVLNVRDLAPNNPITLLGGKDLDRFKHVWRHCNVYFAGPTDELLSAAIEAVGRLRAEAKSVGIRSPN